MPGRSTFAHPLISASSASRCLRLLVIVCAATAVIFSASVAAQEGTRMRRIVTGFPAGGSSDLVARLIGDRLRSMTGDTVIVEDRVGAGGRIAIDHVRTAPADGSTMLLVPDATMFLYPHVYRGLTYEPARDFRPVARLAGVSFAMYVGPTVAADVKTVADFVAWVRADAGRRVYGTPAAGATPHFTGAMFARATGLTMTPVHYRGGGPGIQDLAAGHVPVFFGAVSDGLAMARAGRIRALATSGPQRAAALPDVPTFAELGYHDLVIQDGLGIYLPAGAEPAQVDRLATTLVAVLSAVDVRTALTEAGLEIEAEGPLAFAMRLQRERIRWGAIVKATGFAASE